MPINKTVQQLILEVNELFMQSDIHFGQGMESALDEAAYLVSFIAEMPPQLSTELLSRAVTVQQYDAVLALANRRITERQPLAYLIGATWYRGIHLQVSPAALIPRSPIGELIEQEFSPWVSTDRVSSILDLCCGGGSLGILSALYFQDATVVMADIDAACVQLATHNCQLNEVADRVSVVQSDLFSHVPDRKYDIIVSNPPYVPLADMRELPPEFRHEPPHALSAGPSGLDFAHRILSEAGQYLAKNGILVLEVGQCWPVLEAAYPDFGFTWVDLESGGEGVCVIDYAASQHLLGRFSQHTSA